MTVVGFLALAKFIHPTAAHLSPALTAKWFHDHHAGVELGMSIFALATAPLALYTVELTLVMWRREGTPLFAFGQLLGGFGVVMLIFISCCLWIGAAYRAGSANPDVTVALNDASWFGFLVGWVILALQMVCSGVVVVADTGPDRLGPRSAGWAAILGGVALATANGCVFTKGGVFGNNGVLGYYLPMTIWGVWLLGYAWLVRRDVKRRMATARRQEAAGAEARDVLALGAEPAVV
jgi:hypothetical protein